jgi:hypothetical protein
MALALEFEEKWSEATELYLKVADSRAAIRCYWCIGDFASAAQVPGETTGLEWTQREASRFVVFSEPHSSVFLSSLENWLAGDESRLPILRDRRWAEVLQTAIQRVARDVSASSDVLASSLLAVRQIAVHGLRCAPIWEFAHLAARVGEHGHCNEIWRQVDDRSSPSAEIRLSLVLVLPYPENLPYLEGLARWDDITKSFGEDPKRPLSPEHQILVAGAIARIRPSQELRQFLEGAHPETLERVLRFAEISSDPGRSKWVLQRVLRQSAQSGRYELLQRVLGEASRKGDLVNFAWQTALRETLSANNFSVQNARTREAFAKLIDKQFGTLERAGVLLEAAAVVERQGNFVESLRFYERVEKSESVSRTDRRTAKIRWLRVKFEQRGKSQSPLKDKEQREINEKLRDAGVARPHVESLPLEPPASDFRDSPSAEWSTDSVPSTDAGSAVLDEAQPERAKGVSVTLPAQSDVDAVESIVPLPAAVRRPDASESSAMGGRHQLHPTGEFRLTLSRVNIQVPSALVPGVDEIGREVLPGLFVLPGPYSVRFVLSSEEGRLTEELPLKRINDETKLETAWVFQEFGRFEPSNVLSLASLVGLSKTFRVFHETVKMARSRTPAIRAAVRPRKRHSDGDFATVSFDQLKLACEMPAIRGAAAKLDSSETQDSGNSKMFGLLSLAPRGTPVLRELRFALSVHGHDISVQYNFANQILKLEDSAANAFRLKLASNTVDCDHEVVTGDGAPNEWHVPHWGMSVCRTSGPAAIQFRDGTGLLLTVGLPDAPL